MSPSLPSSYFEKLYAAADDPWRISSGWYEQRKRAMTLAALPKQVFALGLEPGCSNGDLTAELAPRCRRLVAWDVVDAAVDRTRLRTARCTGVEVRHGALPGGWPSEQGDLVVLSEVGYYLDEDDLGTAVENAQAHLVPGGTLVAVHWRHPAPDYPLSGDRVHELISEWSGLHRLARYLDEDVILDVLTNGPATSVAHAVGVL